MSKPEPIRVSIVDDDSRIRNSLQALIEGSEGFVCASAHPSAEEVLREIAASKPNVVLLDINLPRTSGIECIQEIKSRLPAVKILMYTVYEDEEQLFKSLRAGAHGYLLKRTPPAKLLEAIADIHAGNSVMSSQIARLVVKYFHQLGPASPTDNLTHREVDILQHLARGYQNKEIADLLGIGFDTVRTHLRNIYEKLHVNSRTEAVMKFLGR
ncbi:MAG TPA: response regulator transcription factor [Verrucomicrobiae bacterium]|nr:response regulator transcription factor [Verrucomicrobiae bacterium]